MTEMQITTRLLCSESQISEREFHDGSFNTSDMHKLTRAVATLKKAKIFIDPTPSLKILELRSKARRLKQQHKIELIVIDYLQLMKAPGTNSRQEEVAEISSGVKAIAKELHVPILILAQLNRDTERAGTTGPVKPKLSSLRESGAIEQDADVVAFLHRDRDAQKNISPETLKNGIPADIIVEKNRNGETGISELLFFPQYTQFRNKSHRYGDDDIPQGL
jgi:replicative DNA helicase